MSELRAETATAERLEKLHAAIDRGAPRTVRGMLNDLYPAEIAALLEAMPPAERLIVFPLVNLEDHGEVLTHLNDEVRVSLIDQLDDEALIAATADLELDDLADILDDLPDLVIKELLASMDHQNRSRLEAVLGYDENSAGGLMNVDTITVRPDVTLDVVLRYLRRRGSLPEQTTSLFVVNRRGHYLGIIQLADLLVKDSSLVVREVMDEGIIAIDANKSSAEVAKLFEDRDFLAAPVVDEGGLLLGRITIDDVVDVIRDEAEHQILSQAGLDEDDDMFAPVVSSARRRGLWLGINLFTAFLASWVVGIFEGTIQQLAALAVLMPVVASMGGIAGSQTLTLMVRGIALGKIGRRNRKQLLVREVSIGVLNGFFWAMVVGAVAAVIFQNSGLGLVIAVALVINQIMAALAGVLIPLILNKLEIDPALAGSVVLTTVTDVIGFGAFLGLGSIFLVGN